MTGLNHEQIADLETQLGARLPSEIRGAYQRANGLRGPTDIGFLWPHDDTSEGILKQNLFLKDRESLPLQPVDAVYFGDDGTGGILFFQSATFAAGIWHPADGAETHSNENSVAALWATLRRLYEEAAAS